MACAAQAAAGDPLRRNGRDGSGKNTECFPCFGNPVSSITLALAWQQQRLCILGEPPRARLPRHGKVFGDQ